MNRFWKPIAGSLWAGAGAVVVALLLSTSTARANNSACTNFHVGKSVVFPQFSDILAASPNGKKLLLQTIDRKMVLYDLASGKTESLFDLPSNMRSNLWGCFSKDGSKVVIEHLPSQKSKDDSVVRIYDVKNQKFTDYETTEVHNVSNDGSKVMFTPPEKKAVVFINLVTGKKIEAPYPAKRGTYWGQITGDGRHAVLNEDEKQVTIIDTTIGTSRKIPVPTGFRLNDQRAPTGKILLSTEDGKIMLIDKNTGEKSEFSPGARPISPYFSKDGKSLYLIADQKVVLLELATGKTTSLKHDGVHIKPDDKWVSGYLSELPERHQVIAWFDGKSSKVDFTNAKIEPLSEDWKYTNISDDGNITTQTSGDSGLLNVEYRTKNLKMRLPIPPYHLFSRIAPDGSSVVTGNTAGNNYFASLETVCVPLNFKVEPTTIDCVNCPADKKVAGPISENEISALSGPMIGQLCSQDFNATAWDNSIEPSKPPKLSREAVYKYLLRFQKPGGFDPKKHLAILMAILESDFLVKDLALVQRTLQGVLAASDALYEDLIYRFPVLAESPKESLGPSRECLSDTEKKTVTEAAAKHVRNIINIAPGKTNFSFWKRLYPLANALSRLGETEKDQLQDGAAQRIADKAADSPELHDVFLSKLYKFSYQAAAPLFGSKQKPITDVTLVRTAENVTPIILGMSAVDGDSKSSSPYGFYYKSLKAMHVDKFKDAHLKPVLIDLAWKQVGQQFKAQIGIGAAKPLGVIIPPGNGPKYDELWKDGTLTGIIVTGSNLKGLAAGVMDEYLAYFKGQGFQFDSAPEQIKDLHAFLKTKVESGEADYLIKEAHSDGDEKNLFRLDTFAKVIVGTNKRSDGKKEKVYLVFPENNPDSTLLSNEEFGDWLRSREKAGKGQLVYFNTSCWSKTKAVHEIEAAYSTVLLNIPTMTSTDTFTTDKTNAENILLTSFRRGDNYGDIRKALQENEDFRNHRGNWFIFPDDPEYDQNIRSVLKVPLKTTTRITDSKGQVYSLEQEH